MKKLTREEFLSRCKVHNHMHDYTNTTYTNSRTKVVVGCPIHGNFTALPKNLMRGSSCPECGNIVSTTKRVKTKDTFSEEATALHNGKYSYNEVNYISSKHKVTITCPLHGTFEQSPNSHLAGQGCPRCGQASKTSIWSNTAWREAGEISDNFTAYTLYIITCSSDNEQFIKIGKTFRTLEERFEYGMPYTWEPVHIITGTADYISNLERRLHKDLKSYKYVPDTSFGGLEECFTAEILTKDLLSGIEVKSTSKP